MVIPFYSLPMALSKNDDDTILLHAATDRIV